MPVKNRRPGREAALRVLYQMEIGDVSQSEATENLESISKLSPDAEAFADRLVTGILKEWRELDNCVGRCLKDWTVERLAIIDRTILRIATFELYWCPEVPPAVSMNEAIELAKKYSTAESSKFVNGVLSGVLAASPKANWDRAAAPPEQEFEDSAPSEHAPEVVEEVIDEDSKEAKELARIGQWKLRSEPPQE